ncbi:MAG: ATP-binding protein [Pseudomonadota bacterium]
MTSDVATRHAIPQALRGMIFVMFAIGLSMAGYSIWLTNSIVEHHAGLLKLSETMRHHANSLYRRLILAENNGYEHARLMALVDAELRLIDIALAGGSAADVTMSAVRNARLRDDLAKMQRLLASWRATLAPFSRQDTLYHAQPNDISLSDDLLIMVDAMAADVQAIIIKDGRRLIWTNAITLAVLLALFAYTLAWRRRYQKSITVRAQALDELVARRTVELQQALENNAEQMAALRVANIRIVTMDEVFKTLRDIAQQLFMSRDYPDFYKQVIGNAMKMTGAQSGALYFLDGAGAAENIVTCGLNEESLVDIEEVLREQAVRQALSRASKTAQVAVLQNQAFESAKRSLAGRGVLAVRLVADATIYGILYLMRKQGEGENAFSDDDEVALDMYARELTQVLDHQSLIEALERDNAERRAAEASLAQARARIQSLIDNSPALIYSCRPDDYALTYISDNIERIFGARAADFIGDAHLWMERVHPDDLPGVMAKSEELLANGERVLECRARRNDGKYCWIRDNARVVRDAAGRPVEILGVVTDITEYKLAEQAMRTVEATAQATLDALANRIVLLNDRGEIIAVNAAWRDYAEQPHSLWRTGGLGIDYLELVRERSSQITLGDGDMALGLEKLLAGQCQEYYLEYLHATAPDARWYALHAARFQSSGGLRIVVSEQDITQRRLAEEELRQQHAALRSINIRLEAANLQLLQSEKMAAIGQLAAGVAHEINNPVGYVNSNLSSLQRYVDDLFRLVEAYGEAEPVLPEHAAAWRTLQTVKQEVDLDFLKQDIVNLLNESQEGVARVRDIVQNLKSFSHVDDQEWQWNDLHKGLDSTLNIVQNELKYKARVIKEYGDLPQIECRLSQLNQVFMNLLVNAVHAMEERGNIWLRTGAENESVWVEIEDTGKGIAPEHLSRIFEPFFTTKPVGSGTGLGLSLSYDIITKHGGRIEVASTLGKGTCFRMYLPRCRPAVAETRAAVAEAEGR